MAEAIAGERQHRAAAAIEAAGHGLAVEAAENIVQRAHIGKRRGRPAHRFGPGEALDRGVHDAGNCVGGRSALLFDDGEIILGAFDLALLAVIER